MKHLIYILIILLTFSAKAQQRFPSGFPTQFNTGWNKWGYAMSDSGTVIANRDTNWLAKYSGTVVFKPSNKRFYWFDSTNLTWNQFGSTIDTTSLSNRINLKLNISDTATMLLPYLRKADTTNKWVQDVYVRNDSLFKFKNGAETFLDTLGNGGGGGSGLTSVGLSMPSAFTVTNSPLTSDGVIAVSGAGTSLQYIRGNGTLATTDTGMIPNFHLKVRSLLTGTSPITLNQTTGVIGINNATATGTKGAAAFTGAFSDNGSGLIDLLDVVTAGSCIGCVITFDSKGRATAFSNGVSSIDTLNGLTAKRQYFATGTSGTDFNISSSGNTHTFNIPDASGVARGLVTTGAQTFAGVKTFNSDINVRGAVFGIGGGGVLTNLAAGANALNANTTGSANVGVGAGALVANTTGSFNIAIGNNTLVNNNSGAFNIAIGTISQQLAGSANSNISIGYLTLNSNFGNENVVIGHLAARQLTGSGNVIIGASAAESDLALSNALVISNTSSKKLIHGDFLNDSIKINGKLRVRDIDSTTSALNMLYQDPVTKEIKKSAAPIGGIVTLNTLTATTQTFATGSSGTDFNISSSGSTHTYNIPSASTVNRGLVTISSQTFGGLKTFNDGAVVTLPSSSSGVNLTVSGDKSLASAPGISGRGILLASFTFTNTSGAGTESSGQNFHLVGTPTLTSSNAISYTGDVSTMRFSGAPIASGSTTIDHPYNIYANDVSKFAGLALALNEQASDATLASASGFNVYTGVGGHTWTLPTLSTHPGKIILIKNAGGGDLTVQRGGSDNIYTTSSVTSIIIAAGADVIVCAGSAFWYVQD